MAYVRDVGDFPIPGFVASAMSAKKFRRDLKFVLGDYRVHPDDCKHDRKKIFNGHMWRCAECGEKVDA
jgi:rubrerythrin